MKFFVDPNDPLLSAHTDEEKVFFVRIVPLAQRIQSQSSLKFEESTGITTGGIFASLVIADILVSSEFGNHPLAKDKYAPRIPGNNFNLSESSTWWERDRSCVLIDGLKYKCYRSWEEFVNNQSDEYAYTDMFDSLLQTTDLETQIYLMHVHRRAEDWADKVKSTIRDYKLSRFDFRRT